MSDTPFFHDASNAVRFLVTVDGRSVDASIGKTTLHYHFRTGDNADPLETYASHAEEIDAAVRRRLAQGSTPPVMLREHDLRSTG